MSSLAKLKDEARRHEQREEWERAIQLYLRVLKGSEAQEGELPLYNRIGDLYVRMGRAVDAVQYYEEAADHYAQAGLFNNAIALCNKALRYTPNRPELYRKVGRYCAMQGFTTDARRWFLEYAERVFAVGELEEAFSALDEFADLGADPDVRELLGHMLHKYDRMDDALREFRRAYGLRLQAGDEAATERLRKEVASLFPDLEELTPETIQATSGAQPDRPPEEAGRLPGIGERGQGAAVADDGVIPGEGAGGAAPSGTIDGLETTPIAGAEPTSQSGAGAMPGLEPTSLTADDRAGSGDDSLQPLPLLRSSSEEEEEKERKA